MAASSSSSVSFSKFSTICRLDERLRSVNYFIDRECARVARSFSASEVEHIKGVLWSQAARELFNLTLSPEVARKSLLERFGRRAAPTVEAWLRGAEPVEEPLRDFIEKVHKADRAGEGSVVTGLIRTHSKRAKEAVLKSLKRGDSRLLELLIESGVDLSATDFGGNSPLHLASLTHNVDAVIRLLTSGQFVSVEATNGEGFTPLHLIARRGAEGTDPDQVRAIVNFLVGRGAPLERVVPCRDLSQKYEEYMECPYGDTPFLYACRLGDIHAARALADVKASIDAQDASGECGVHLAAAAGSLALLRYLIKEKKCNPNAQNKDGETPLIVAVMLGQSPEVIEAMIAMGCDTALCDETGRTAYDHLIGDGRRGDPQTYRGLFDYLDPSLVGPYGPTEYERAWTLLAPSAKRQRLAEEGARSISVTALLNPLLDIDQIV